MIIGIENERTGIITLINKPPLKWYERLALKLTVGARIAGAFVIGVIIGGMVF